MARRKPPARSGAEDRGRRSPAARSRRSDRASRAARGPREGGARPAGARSRRRAALAAVALGVLAAVIYLPAVTGEFLWDDAVFTEAAPVREASGLASIWFSPAAMENEGHYWPLVHTTFWLEHKLWGFNPVPFHLTNILLHLVNTLLLWQLLRRLKTPGAWVAAAVFAVHPVHVESVAWVIERKDVLSALFYLTAAAAWMRFVEAPRRSRYLLALALFTAGLLSKSIVVTLPAALLIWHWWKFGRITATDLRRLAPFALVAAFVTAADLSFYAGRESVAFDYSLPERALIAARVLWFYAGKLLWPSELAVIYPHWEVGAADLRGWAALLGALALAAALWFGRGRIGRGPLAGAAFFAVTLAPVLGLIDYGYMQFSFVADRHQYLASIGPLAVLAAAAARLARGPAGAAAIGNRRPAAAAVPVAVAVAVAVLGSLGVLSWRQAGIYRDEVTFFRHIVAHNPEARGAHHNLGRALLRAGRPEEALAAGRIAVERDPGSADKQNNVGVALLRSGRPEEAAAYFERARALEPLHLHARQNLAELFRKQGRPAAAVEAYREVLELDGDFALAHAGMGAALFGLGRHEEAAQAFNRAAALAPDPASAAEARFRAGLALSSLGQRDRAESHFRRARQGGPDNLGAFLNIAETFRKQADHAAAIDAYRQVLEMDGAHAPAHAGLGDALLQLERHREALAALEQAVALRPDLPNLGRLYRLMGRAAQELDRPDAAELYERAIELDPRDTESLDRLALLRFGQQRYEEALARYRALLEINPDNARTHANLGATLFRLDRIEEAARSFERAVALDPSAEEVRADLERLRRLLP